MLRLKSILQFFQWLHTFLMTLDPHIPFGCALSPLRNGETESIGNSVGTRLQCDKACGVVTTWWIWRDVVPSWEARVTSLGSRAIMSSCDHDVQKLRNLGSSYGTMSFRTTAGNRRHSGEHCIKGSRLSLTCKVRKDASWQHNWNLFAFLNLHNRNQIR